MTSELLNKQRWRLIRRLIGVAIVITLAITLIVLYKHENEKKFMQLAPEVVTHNSTFAIKLYTQLQDQPGNLIFSPSLDPFGHENHEARVGCAEV